MWKTAVLVVAWVALCQSADTARSVEGNRPLSCHGECPEYELLCSSPEYAVRRYKSGLWVSTSVQSPSITKANLIGRRRLHKYLKGENHEKTKMAAITPLVLQMRRLPGNPTREVTVSMMLPRDVASNPPKPIDPKVVIDLVPETIVYVKSFPRQGAGFVPEREAEEFLRTLSEREELFEHEDYFHIAQYDSLSSGMESQNEIWIFAINEVTYRMLQVTGSLDGGQGIPRCLRQDNRPLRWTKINPANVPVLTRDRCPSSFCEEPHCPKYEVMERVGDTIEKRHYTALQVIGYVATSCHYDTAVDQAYMPLWQQMNDTGISSADVQAFVTTIVQSRKDLDGEKGCEKFFVLYYAMDGTATASTVLTKTNNGQPMFQIPKTIQALHGKKDITTFYTQCFGGNVFYDPHSISDTGKLLLDTMKEAGKCVLGDHISISEYHPQSRLFDRYNEIMVDSDEGCSDPGDRPAFSYDIPLSSSYLEPMEVPDVTELCNTTDCAQFSVKMTLGDNLRLVSQDPAKFVCTESTPPSCTYYEAYHKALHPILAYINGKNKDGVSMDMTKPLFGHVLPSERPCGKSFVLCMYLSEKYFDSPPQPLTDSVRISFDENEFVAYEKSFVGNFESTLIDVRVRERIDEMLLQLDGLEPFGVKYNPKLVWLAAYSDPGKEETVMKLFVRDDQNVQNKRKTQVAPTAKDSSAQRYLPMPTSCHSRECLPVRVVQDYGNFLEVYFPKVKGVYTQQNVCESGTSGRLLLQPLHKYFHGYNMEEDEIGGFSYPVSLRYRLFFEHGKEVDVCDALYEMSVALPASYADREIPEPIAEKMKTFERNGTYMYVVAVSGIYSQETIKDKTYHLLVDLTQEHLTIERYYSVIFTYDPPFTDIEERMTYIGLVKESQNGDNSESQDVGTSKGKEQVKQQQDD
ncbi:HEBP2 [Branchiostoma lanceolatum]|uniref:HEBP2 protein n=1 Tax=Branchiostoma lanceolatum TaxID=7740 RepID=A0A8K0AAW7_BRALA|nr:HEBP2 [Branchiostoma lanceolatum]